MSDNEQMNKKVETVADILEEMRGMGNYQRYSGDHAHALADRIEAAWKRKRAKVEADALSIGGIVEAARHKPVGNAAAMREALLKLRSEIGRFCYNDWIPYDVWQECDDVISHALSSPPRNCDVGTVEEQESRYERFCDSHKWVDDEGANGCLSDCPLYNASECSLHWAQMPHETEEGGAK